MIFNFQSQAICNPIELAQQRLKNHQENGTGSNLSIFEVASLMDTVVFGPIHGEGQSNSNFQICFN